MQEIIGIGAEALAWPQSARPIAQVAEDLGVGSESLRHCVLDAPKVALGTRRAGADLQLIHHSDRGSKPLPQGPDLSSWPGSGFRVPTPTLHHEGAAEVYGSSARAR